MRTTTYKRTGPGIATIVGAAGMAILLCQGVTAEALPVDLGSAGPGNWAVLETGNHAGNANVSIANASNAGYINGNVGMNSRGGISDSGTPITGNVYLGSSAGANGNLAANVSGSVYKNAGSQTRVSQAAADAASVASAASALSGSSIGDITTGGTFSHAPGVYFLNSINLSGVTLTLDGTANEYYVFNIADALTLSHASILLSGGLTAQNVLFNITRTGGTGLGMSGGLATESVLYGIVLADSSQIQESPGLVVGEMICGDNMSISSGAQVQGIKVPDGGETAALLGAALLGIAGLRRKLRQG